MLDNSERQLRVTVMFGGTVLGDGLNHVNALPLIGRSGRVESQSGRISLSPIGELEAIGQQKSQRFNRNPALKLYTGSLWEIV